MVEDVEIDDVSHKECPNRKLTSFSPHLGIEFCELSMDGADSMFKVPSSTMGSTSASFTRYSEELSMDASVVPLRSTYEHPVTHVKLGGMYMLQSMKMMYPLIDDPYTMGYIACSASLNGLYAMGVSKVDNILMLLGMSTEMTSIERNSYIPHLMKGFMDCAIKAADTCVEGGQSVLNPWTMIGGIASVVCHRKGEFLGPETLSINIGDYIVVTKPIGTLAGLIAQRWMETEDFRLAHVMEKLKNAKSFIQRGFDASVATMCRLNKGAAGLLRKHNVHLSTEVSRGGIVGAANTLIERLLKADVENANDVTMIIHRIPVVEGVVHIARQFNAGGASIEHRIMNSIFNGTAPEISGGLLLVIPHKSATDFCREMHLIEKQSAFIIGKVEGRLNMGTSNLIPQPPDLSTDLLDSSNVQRILPHQHVRLISEPWVVDGDSPMLHQEI
ncbi:hypothetical protein ACOME3_010139 [Neoechinorhynchus agilis]